MRDWNYVLSEDHQEKQWSTHEAVAAEPDWVRRFCSTFLQKAADEGIPLYVQRFLGPVNEPDWRGVRILHAQWEDRLDDRDWYVLGSIGLSAARACDVRVVWCGRQSADQSDARPDFWTVYCPPLDDDGCSD